VPRKGTRTDRFGERFNLKPPSSRGEDASKVNLSAAHVAEALGEYDQLARRLQRGEENIDFTKALGSREPADQIHPDETRQRERMGNGDVELDVEQRAPTGLCVEEFAVAVPLG